MAVDKKSDYVGDHGGRYTDYDGQTKQFSYVDHDKKTKISTGVLTEDEVSSVKRQLDEYREKLVGQILSLPPQALPVSHNDRFNIFRDRHEDHFSWNEVALRDPTIELSFLQAIKHFTQCNVGRTY